MVPWNTLGTYIFEQDFVSYFHTAYNFSAGPWLNLNRKKSVYYIVTVGKGGLTFDEVKIYDLWLPLLWDDALILILANYVDMM